MAQRQTLRNRPLTAPLSKQRELSSFQKEKLRTFGKNFKQVIDNIKAARKLH